MCFESVTIVVCFESVTIVCFEAVTIVVCFESVTIVCFESVTIVMCFESVTIVVGLLQSQAAGVQTEVAASPPGCLQGVVHSYFP